MRCGPAIWRTPKKIAARQLQQRVREVVDENRAAVLVGEQVRHSAVQYLPRPRIERVESVDERSPPR